MRHDIWYDCFSQTNKGKSSVTAMKNHRIVFFIAILVSIFVEVDLASAQDNCTGNQIFTAKACVGDGNSADEKALFEIINKYRAANGRSAIKLSAPLSVLGNRRMLDLRQNLKTLTHSWSNCPYELKNEKTWPCVMDAPERLKSGYRGQGYETLFRTATGNATPNAAIEAWKKSALHSSIILNQGMFQSMPWDEVGVAIDGQYAALWFGYPGGGANVVVQNTVGLGVSYDQAISGLSRLLSIDQASSTVENNTWQGFSPDKKLKLEISGTRKEIGEATVGITIKLDPNGKLDPAKKLVLANLLKNIFPEWPDVDTWLDNSLNMISQNPTAWRTKVVRKNLIEMKLDSARALRLSIRPQAKPASVEIF
jgi:hypothetical protein